MTTSDPEDLESPNVLINRERSWLSFARRVMELAEDPRMPLLERVKFAGIMGMLYDEFAMKRIGGLMNRIQQGSTRISPDGLTPAEELDLCRPELHRQAAILARLVEDELRPALRHAGIGLLGHKDLDEAQRDAMTAYFRTSVAPILTPLAVDAGHPFPFISNLGLNLAVWLTDPEHARDRFVRLKIPANRPRWVPLPGGGYIPLEQVIEANLTQIFPSAQRIEAYGFRVTRGAKDDPWRRVPEDEDEDQLSPGSLIGMVSDELTARRFAGVVRLQVSSALSKDRCEWLATHIGCDPADIEPIDGLLALTDLVDFQPDGYGELRDAPHRPIDHPRLVGLDPHDPDAMLAEIRRGDILLHHPYHSFDSSVLRFFEQAARDPKVLAIKLTIYRTSRQSPIIQALVEAARRGKQVAALVEITARFDEAPNIAWGEQLENVGAHVVYGMERLKTHVKLALVVREEADGLRRYVHVATGNYHPGTARLYEDLGIMSCEPELAENVAAVFNELTAAIPLPDYGPLLVAPHNLRERFTALIRHEAEHARAGRPCGIRAKMNQLQDPSIIRELYAAGQAGVPITLAVRGLCCLRAGVVGLSENIRVFSTLGRFLEHGRIYRFENAGEPRYFIGSADWMRRNLDSRMETVMPVRDPQICRELEQILAVYEEDNCSAWDMQPDGRYIRRQPEDGEPCRPAQEVFIQRTEQSVD